MLFFFFCFVYFSSTKAYSSAFCCFLYFFYHKQRAEEKWQQFSSQFFFCFFDCVFFFYLFVVKLNNNKEQRVESTNKSLASFSQTLFSSRFPLPVSYFFLEVFFSCSEYCFSLCIFFFLGLPQLIAFQRHFFFAVGNAFVGRRLETKGGGTAGGERVDNEKFFLLLFFCICDCLFYPFAIVLFHYNISYVFLLLFLYTFLLVLKMKNCFSFGSVFFCFSVHNDHHNGK